MDYNFSSYEELADLVDEHEGVITVEMRPIRDAHDVGRLGKHVRDNISKELLKRGLGHHPSELPPAQHEMVRVYRMGTPIAELIHAVTEASSDHDDHLRKVVNSDAQETLERVKELVCDV